MPKIKIALLSGGKSEEREVSLKTGEQIYNSLDREKYEISRFDPKTDLKRFIDACIAKSFDMVFPALHGSFGEDGRLQGMLDMLDMPYLFSGCKTSALAMNKHKTLLVARETGLNTSPSLVLRYDDRNEFYANINILGLPIVVKPLESGSSVGISIAKNENELSAAIDKAFLSGREILLEKFISGRELTVAVMGDTFDPEALPVIEIKPMISEWFDYEAKYKKGGSDEVCPAKIPEEIAEQVQLWAKMIYSALGCHDLARADFIWDENNDNLYFLEINTIPGMTETSLAPLAARAKGFSFSDFLDALIEGALKRHN